MALKDKKIGFIGGGNMAEALIAGLLSSRQARASRLMVSEPSSARRSSLKKRFKIRTVTDNGELLSKSDIVVLAVKPQVMSQVLGEIGPALRARHLIISIAAGIDTRYILSNLGHAAPRKLRLIRAMPNTPALIGQGMTGLFVTRQARAEDRQVTEALFSAVGKVIVFRREAELDWVTAVSGSGPAYVFHFLAGWIDAARRGGLSAAEARTLVLETAKGAVALASASSLDLPTLRKRVTSKGGTTEAALRVLSAKKWAQTHGQAVRAAARHAKRLRKSVKK